MHAKTQQRTYDVEHRDQDATRFYTSTEWRNCRAAILSQRLTCEVCGALATDVHHVRPLALAWERRTDPANLMALDGRCHKRIEAYRKATGDLDGMPEVYRDE